jgi:hypothetical protein
LLVQFARETEAFDLIFFLEFPAGRPLCCCLFLFGFRNFFELAVSNVALADPANGLFDPPLSGWPAPLSHLSRVSITHMMSDLLFFSASARFFCAGRGAADGCE